MAELLLENSEPSSSVVGNSSGALESHDLKRVKRAMECIERDHLAKSKEDAIAKGKGIAFWFFPRPDVKGIIPDEETSSSGDTVPNCLYSYVEQGTLLWDRILKVTDREAIEKVYDSEKMYMVCVAVQTDDGDDEELQLLKLFSYDGDEVVKF